MYALRMQPITCRYRIFFFCIIFIHNKLQVPCAHCNIHLVHIVCTRRMKKGKYTVFFYKMENELTRLNNCNLYDSCDLNLLCAPSSGFATLFHVALLIPTSNTQCIALSLLENCKREWKTNNKLKRFVCHSKHYLPTFCFEMEIVVKVQFCNILFCFVIDINRNSSHSSIFHVRMK